MTETSPLPTHPGLAASDSWQVHKFGGTSLADAPCIRRAAKLATTDATNRTAVVVSAMAGVTDELAEIVSAASSGTKRETLRGRLAELGMRHEVVARELLGRDAAPLCNRITSVLPGLERSLAHVKDPAVRARILGQGERWAARLLVAYLISMDLAAAKLDAEEVLVVDNRGEQSVVHWSSSGERLRTWLRQHDPRVMVVTGFVARSVDGSPTTLSRNGSDHSAAIFARLLHARSLTIWKDVDGIATADPRRVSDAQLLPCLSFAEARSLTLRGATVLHPAALDPAEQVGLPIQVRNTFAPERSGTWITPRRTSVIPVTLFGPGQVGGAFLDQLAAQLPAIERSSAVEVRVARIIGSGRMVEDPEGLPLAQWRQALSRGSGYQWAQLAASLRAPGIVVDCTAADSVAAAHADWLGRGIHVVTANKRGLAASRARAERILSAARDRGVAYGDEATVGAGLPVLSTLRDLLRSGDDVLRVEGLLSGTLSHVFARLRDSVPFCTALYEARELGYTEPDPEEDLQGRDVHRKALILARHLGIVPIDAVPEPLSSDDAHWARARATAASQHRVLVPRVVVEAQGLTFGVEALPLSHPLATVQAGDNAVVFTTRRYRERPLVVAGPGAGPDVTAAAVLADVCTAVSLTGGRR